MKPGEIEARLLYRDGMMLVLDKPAGLPVHRGPKGGNSFEDYFDALRFGLPRPPALAHRLDRDTSGCLVLGRHRKALELLGKLFKNGRIRKTYWALVEGGPAEPEGRIDLALGRRDPDRGWWMKPDPQGQPAVTNWQVMGRSACGVSTAATPPGAGGAPLPFQEKDEHGQRDAATLAWLALEPLTGRTHQLRVHCAEMGFPILGDTIYGTAPRAGGPVLHLHAREIVVPIAKNKPPVRIVAPVPPHMRDGLLQCGWDGTEPAPDAAEPSA